MTKNIYAILQLSAILVSLAVDVIGATGKQSAFDRQQQTTVGQVENLRLINADTNLPILNITNNLVINLYNLNTNNFGIQATVAANSGTVGSIRFAYNDIPRYRTDSVTPFSLCPTTGGRNYQTCPVLGIGNHRVTATPYSNANASGTIGLPYQVTFQIIYVATTPAPITSNPTLAPIPLCRVPQFIDASWQNFLPKYPIKNGEPQGLLIGNDLVIFGGFTNSFTIATNRTYARDITSNTSKWRQMDDMPLVSGITHAATVAVGQQVYFCGGYQGAHPGPHVPYCFIYDHSKAPGTGKWSNFTYLPNGGTAGAGMIYDSSRNMLFYTGGGQRLIPGSVHPIDVRDTWKISLSDPSTGWLASTPIPYFANHLSYVTHRDATTGAERHFFLAGQLQEYESSGNLARNYEFLAATETWIRRADMPFPRSHAAASTRAIGCGFVIAGGSANSDSTKKNRIADVSYYDIPSNTWTTGIGFLPYAGATPIVVIHPNGYMHFVNAVPISSRRRIAA